MNNNEWTVNGKTVTYGEPEVDTSKPLEAFKVPASLAELYKHEPEPTELEVLKALQGDGTKEYGLKMLHTVKPWSGMVDERQAMEQAKHPDFQKFVAHRMRLERAHAKVMEAKHISDRAESKAINDARTTCPVCSEIAPDNYLGKPCKRCVVVIEQKLAESKVREAAVDKWLKSHEYSWVGRL